MVSRGDAMAQQDSHEARRGAAPSGAGKERKAPGSARPAKADPASRSFVVELIDDEDDAGTCRGRVQHLATLDGGNFTSAETLVAIMRRVLDRLRRDRDS